jgi:transcription elongation factor Elf1
MDGLFTSIPLNRYPFPVINAFMFRKPVMKFVLTKIIHSIPKRKGQSDIAAIRMILDTIRNEKRGVMLFPEGNSSYFGKESPIPVSTAKLIKKIKLDLVVCKVNGGHLTSPRWADKPVRKGFVDVHYFTLFTAQELETIGVEELQAKIVETLKFNDFDWNRIERHPYSLRHRAEGLERYIYSCPLCGNTQCITTKKHQVFCKHCGKIAEFNEFSLLEGLPFDNLVDWDVYQKSLLPELAKKSWKTTGVLEEVEFLGNRIKATEIGHFQVELSEGKLTLSNPETHLEFILSDLKNLTLTRKEELSFDVGEKTYFIAQKDPMLFFDLINHLNGGMM